MPPGLQEPVLLVIAQLDTGGAEGQVVHLARRLVKEGFRPEVAVFYPGGHLEPDLLAEGIPVHHVRRTTKLGLESIFHLRRILVGGRHRIVHSFLWPANWRARIAGILASTPVIIASVRSVDTWMRFHHVWVDRLLARRTQALTANAAAIRDYLVARERIPSRLIHVVPNGIETDRFNELPGKEAARAALGLPKDAPLVLSVGNLRPAKNQGDFLRMASNLKARGAAARFVLVGDGEDRPALEAMAARLGVAERVHWAGRRTDVRPFLAACDVLVNTSHREGCCNAILEAMAAGLPTVAYAVGGNPELVEAGRTGRLVPLGDVEALARGVLDYIDDPARGRADGQEARRRALREFGVETMVARTAALYRTLLAAREPAA